MCDCRNGSAVGYTLNTKLFPSTECEKFVRWREDEGNFNPPFNPI